MHPVGPQIIDQVDHRADAPGQRVCPVDISDLAHQIHNRRYVGNPQYAPYGEHDNHGNEGLSRSPADSGDRMGKCQKET